MWTDEQLARALAAEARLYALSGVWLVRLQRLNAEAAYFGKPAASRIAPVTAAYYRATNELLEVAQVVRAFNCVNSDNSCLNGLVGRVRERSPRAGYEPDELRPRFEAQMAVYRTISSPCAAISGLLELHAGRHLDRQQRPHLRARRKPETSSAGASTASRNRKWHGSGHEHRRHRRTAIGDRHLPPATVSIGQAASLRSDHLERRRCP